MNTQCTHPDNQLSHVSFDTIQVPLFEVKLVCVFIQVKKSHTFISLGREDPSSKEGTLWLFESGFMTNFKWYPSEWFWGGSKTKILVPFHQYTSHIRDQSITRCEGMKSVITTLFNKEGMKTKHIIGALNQLLHNLRPRKVAILVWLAFSCGVHAGAWLKQVGATKNCILCHQGTLEITQHKFIKCPCILPL